MCYWYYFCTTERKWEEKKAEGMKFHAKKLGLTLHCRKENEEEPPFAFTLQMHRDRVSLSGHRDECDPELPAILLLVRLLRRCIWTAAPHPQQVALASEAQQLQCSDTQAVLRDVVDPKAGKEKPGAGHFVIKGLVTFSLFTTFAAMVPLWSAMRDRWIDCISSISSGEIMWVFIFLPKRFLTRTVNTAAPQTASSSQSQEPCERRLYCGAQPAQGEVPCKAEGTAKMGAWKPVRDRQQHWKWTFIHQQSSTALALAVLPVSFPWFEGKNHVGILTVILAGSL